jgi:hypothetical protein
LPEKTQQKTGLHLYFKELISPEGAGLFPAIIPFLSQYKSKPALLYFGTTLLNKDFQLSPVGQAYGQGEAAITRTSL